MNLTQPISISLYSEYGDKIPNKIYERIEKGENVPLKEIMDYIPEIRNNQSLMMCFKKGKKGMPLRDILETAFGLDDNRSN